nr:HigA family addiction module antitoxin [Alteromonas macleodii]|tara:strand:- start:352 stop:711 length:360 start_codon:yes stop_codon:yes gene_type:complete
MKHSMHIGIEYDSDRGKVLIDTGERVSRPEHLKRPHPGEVFKRRCMSKSSLKQNEIAQCLSISTKHLSRFINGHSNLTIELARKLEAVSGISAQAWMHYQVAYDLYRTANSKPNLKSIY